MRTRILHVPRAVTAAVLCAGLAGLAATATGQQASGRGQTAGREAEVLKASEAWFDALMRGDVEALERSQTSDFLTVQQAPGGVAVVTGQEQVANIKKAGAARARFKRTLTSPRVRLYGSVAILTGVATFDGEAGGKPVQSKSVTTEVWVNRDGRWLLAHFQPTDPGRQP